MNFELLLLPPLFASLLAYSVRPYRTVVGWVNGLLSLVSLGAVLGLVAQVLTGGPPATWGFKLGPLHLEEALRVDALSALLLLCVTGVATLTLFLSPGLSQQTDYRIGALRRYHIFINLFIAAMLLAVVANNVGLMWIALEATTIFSAFIIPLKLSQASVEASWKYILINSVGIALAFAGTVLAYFNFVNVASPVEQALNWSTLLAAAPTLQPEVLQLAFVFILVGYGTKAGIAPMHTWKPDAYSESPPPLGALMSSALFAVAMYAILRWKLVVDAAIGPGQTDILLLTLGLLSLIIAAFSIVQARNYKRMLAYSSIEHTGLICFGLALGAPGLFAALLHLVNHTLAKSLMFFLVGNIEDRYGSPLIRNVRGLLNTMPWTASLFTAGLLALIGLPPFGLFVSEFALFRAGFAQDHLWLMGLTLVLLAVIFVSVLIHLNKMMYGQPLEEVAVGETNRWRLAPLFLSLGALVILGLALPAPLLALFNQIVETASIP